MYVLQISLLFQGLFRVPENTFLNSGFQNLQLRGLADHYEMVKLVTEKKKKIKLLIFLIIVFHQKKKWLTTKKKKSWSWLMICCPKHKKHEWK